jgi:hypothetical protein
LPDEVCTQILHFYIPSLLQILYAFYSVVDDGWIVSRLRNELYQLQRLINIRLLDIIITLCELERIGEQPVLACWKVLRRAVKTLRIRIGHLPSASLKHNRPANLLCAVDEGIGGSEPWMRKDEE